MTNWKIWSVFLFGVKLWLSLFSSMKPLLWTHFLELCVCLLVLFFSRGKQLPGCISVQVIEKICQQYDVEFFQATSRPTSIAPTGNKGLTIYIGYFFKGLSFVILAFGGYTPELPPMTIFNKHLEHSSSASYVHARSRCNADWSGVAFEMGRMDSWWSSPKFVDQHHKIL